MIIRCKSFKYNLKKHYISNKNAGWTVASQVRVSRQSAINESIQNGGVRDGKCSEEEEKRLSTIDEDLIHTAVVSIGTLSVIC